MCNQQKDHARAKVTEVVVGKNSVRFSAVLRDSTTGVDVATISSEFKRRGNGNLTVHHAGFYFSSMDLTEMGNATEIFRKSLQVFEQMGVGVVTVDADQIGKYAWASFGFDWNRAETRTKMEGAFRVFLVEHGVGADDARDIASKASEHPWWIAVYGRNGVRLGKTFLLTGPQWSGKMVLDSSEESYQWARKKFRL